MRVRVYFNLHKKLFSIQNKTPRGWRLLKHSSRVVLKDVKFLVYESGRARVLAEKKKNVHAYVEGEWVTDQLFFPHVSHEIRYNPYVAGHFVDTMSGKPIHTAYNALLRDKKIFV